LDGYIEHGPMAAGSRTRRGHLAALAAVLLWALVPIGTRFYVLRLDPYLFNIVRFAASGCGAMPLFFHAKPWRWPRRDQALVLCCAILAVPGYNIAVALGARTLSAGQLGLLIATEPVMIAALTVLVQRRPVHWRMIAGSLLALCGVALTSGALTMTQHFSWVSTAQVVWGAFSWSTYTVLAVRLNRRYGTFGVTGAIVVLGTMALLALSLPHVNSGMLPDVTTLWILAAMGVSSSLVAFLLWNYAGAIVRSERLGLFLYMIPIVSVSTGVQFLGESLTLEILAGGMLIVIGVWIAARRTTMAAD